MNAPHVSPGEWSPTEMALDTTDSLVGVPIRAKREGAGRPGEPKS